MIRILYSVLDTLSTKPDSATYANPFQVYSATMKDQALAQMISLGYSMPPASAFYKGIDMATRDILAGRQSVKYTGEILQMVQVDSVKHSYEELYPKMLQKRFGIQLEGIPTGMVFAWAHLFERGYNLVAVSVFNQYFGCDVQKIAWEAVAQEITRPRR